MSGKNTFKPAWWLKNPHFQSCFASLNFWRKPIPFKVVQLELPDGDFTEYAYAGEADAPCVLLLTGMEGCIQSPYIQLISKAILGMGWQVVVMHYRCCGGSMNRQPKAYNSLCYSDMSYLIEILYAEGVRKPKAAIGFSMGGNILLHYIHKYNKPKIASLMTVSTPFDLYQASCDLPIFYNRFLVRTMKQKAEMKIASGMSFPVTLQQLKKIARVYDFDEQIIAPLYGYDSARAYYQAASCRPFLSEVAVPTLMLHALDDPFIPINSVPESSELSPSIELETYGYGGHVGFIAGAVPGWPSYWLPERVVSWLDGVSI